MSDIVRYYDSDKNPRRGTFPFQPLSDITAEQWADLNEVQQASVEASGFWRKTKPRPAVEPKVTTEKAPAIVPESEAVNG